ncbi:ATP-binding cassette domain-containing protein [Streptomyces sp. JHA26]|uniref:ABC transporter ATP-binding protein n=1 Tax=Streptomyces sp. JHA26 TaxID=1917143 RepID=UPI000989F029|nr:ABC transporter ATP-binding protein [Streptomyces sp. JHA26]
MIQAFGLTSNPRKEQPPAVDDVSFEARAGRVTALLGAQGAGKTTVLRLMLELQHGRGITYFRGRPLHRIAHPSREVGVLLGDVPGHPSRTVRGHLRMLCAAAGVPARRGDEVLESVGLVSLRDERLGTLARGMDRRLGLACALLADPHTLVLDDPAGALSAREARWLHDALRAHAAQGGTVLFSTSDPKEAARAADHVVTLEQGRVVADQEAADFSRTRLRPRVAVRSPHAARLAALLVKEARTGRRSVEVVQESGNRLAVYGSTCADIGETAFRHGILVHQLADEVGDMGPGAGTSPAGEARPVRWHRAIEGAPSPGPRRATGAGPSAAGTDAPAAGTAPSAAGTGPRATGTDPGTTRVDPSVTGTDPSVAAAPSIPDACLSTSDNRSSTSGTRPSAPDNRSSTSGTRPSAPDTRPSPADLRHVSADAPRTAGPYRIPSPAGAPRAAAPRSAATEPPLRAGEPEPASDEAPPPGVQAGPSTPEASVPDDAPRAGSDAEPEAEETTPAPDASRTAPVRTAPASRGAPPPRTALTPVAAAAGRPLSPLPPPLSVRSAPSPLRPLRYELRRATGVGTGFFIGGVVLLVSAVIAVVLARVGHTPQPRLLAAWPRELPLPPTALGAGLLGALAFGDEFRHPALAADRGTVPRRLGLLAAKLVVSAATAIGLAVLTVGCDAEMLHLFYGPELSRVPADWPALGAGWLGLCVGCAWSGVLAAGIFRSTTAGLAAVVAVPVLVVPLVQRVWQGPSVRTAVGFPMRLREVLLTQWPFGGQRYLGEVLRVLAQPVGSALTLSLTVLLCAYLLMTLRGRAR